MSHFYGTLQGNRGEAARGGTKGSGLETIAAGWAGAIAVRLSHDTGDNVNRYVIEGIPWHGSGERFNIATGVLGLPPSQSGDRRTEADQWEVEDGL